MAAPFNPPVKGEDFWINFMLEDYANPGVIYHTPTLEADDFMVYADGTGPTSMTDGVSTIAGILTALLTAAEMDADNIVVVGKDQTDPPQWGDFWLSINPTQGAFNPPTKGVAFEFHICLEDFVVPGRIKEDPTISSSDFLVVKDSGSSGNTLTNAPTKVGDVVMITLTATEMDADTVLVYCMDQTVPKEWMDTYFSIVTTA